MGEEAREEVMAVLPDGLGDDERGVGVEAAKDFQPGFLGIDEAMFFGFIEGMGADGFPALSSESLGEGVFHFGLLRPAFLIGREAQVAIGNEINVAGLQLNILHRTGEFEKNLRKRRDCAKRKVLAVDGFGLWIGMVGGRS